MSRALHVLLDKTPVGILERESRGSVRFEYDAAYQARPGATPLSVAMPVAIRSHTDATVRPWIDNLLPDNPDVLTRWRRQFGASSTEAFDLLATPVGEDCAGAVRFVREQRVPAVMDDDGDIEWLDEDDIAARLRELRTDETDWLGERVRSGHHRVGQFSLAGRQRKTALHHDGERWGVPSGPIPTTHILKPPIEHTEDGTLYEQEVNEHLCLTAAREAGLVAARSQVLTFGSERAIVVTRYDRLSTEGGWRRVHQEDLCQALSVEPRRKYQSDGGPTPSRIAQLLRGVAAPVSAESEVTRFADALAWNWIVGGNDAHAKNYSLLLQGRQVRLAPLYDITSSLVYWPERKVDLAMKLGDDYALFNHRNPWTKAAATLGLDDARLHDRVLQLCAAAPDAFAAAAAATEVVALGGYLPTRLTDAVAVRAADCLRLLEYGNRQGFPAG